LREFYAGSAAATINIRAARLAVASRAVYLGAAAISAERSDQSAIVEMETRGNPYLFDLGINPNIRAAESGRKGESARQR
jgi:hypothetical protein